MVTPIIEKNYSGTESRADVRLWLRLLSCSTIIEKRLRRRLAEQFDTTLPRFDVLAALERHPDGMTMGELSRALLVSNGNVTTIVRQLEADGHLLSRPSAKDARSSVVLMTAAGLRHFQALAAAHHGWIHAMFLGVPPAQQAELYSLLEILKASIASDTGMAKR